MKYWFYSEGNILGPYEPADLLALPAFAEESLVCQESSTGDNPGDWQPAAQVPEIAAALSVGAGRAITAGVTSSIYEYETGYNPAAVNYFESREPGPVSGYGELLDAIDNVLGSYKDPAGAAKAPETDYDLAEKFDIRLSRIQEELEAARWEKNLLLEKIRLKEMEERKNAARIQELEARLKSEKVRVEEDTRELEQVRHLADLKTKADTLRQIEEIKKEEQLLKEESAAAAHEAPARPARPAAEPVTAPAAGQKDLQPPPPPAPEKPLEVKSFKSIKAGAEIKLESAIGREGEAGGDDAGMTSRKLKSLGQTQHPAFEYGKPLPGPEAAPPGAFKPEALEPLPQQAGGLVYDFTVVTSRAPDVQQFQIEPRQDARPVKPPTYDMGIAQPAQAPAPQPMQFQPVQPVMPQPAPAPQPQFQAAQPVMPQPAPAPQPVQFQAAQPAPAPAPVAATVSPSAQPQTFSPAAQPEGSAAPQDKAPAEPADSPEKTQRIPVPETKKGKAEVQKGPDKPRRKGGRTAFIVILVIFGSIAAGGLGYFFLGEGVSLSEFSMLSLGGKKKPSAIPSQIETQTEEALEPEPAPAPVEPEPAPAPAPAPQPANENIKKALDIVKNYRLSGGRGPISTWFANSFLSTSGGASEEWTATPLHGDILVVQYRLLRPKKDPLIYQFEVDAAKQDIVRGINNNAIELLDLSSKEKSASAAPARKAAAKPKARAKKPVRSGEIPILPLPDAPAAGAEEEPTGFENPPLEPEQVRYLKAQESDEELF